jgi:cytoskeletal protein CcmA (bactofilin family)
VDALGQSGGSSGNFSLIIDTVAPNQAVAVTGAASSTSTASSGTTLRMAAPAEPGTKVSGTVAGTLNADEAVIVYRDGVRLGVAQRWGHFGHVQV